MNKDVGILTYDYPTNYGAVLQTFALCEKLKMLNFIPHVIKWGSHYHMTAGIENDNLKMFRDKYLPRTQVCYTTQELRDITSNFSKILIGGDQVFRRWADLEEEPVLRYFGDWIVGEKTLASYGASFGLDYFNGNNELIEKIKFLLKRFDRIGIREKSGVELLKNTFLTNGVEVLDPVFLLDKNKYEFLIDNAPDIKPNATDYIAYMCLGNNSEFGDIDTVLKSTLKNENIVNINKNSNNENNSIEQWLYNIHNAKFVITNSFHCVAFAIIFNRPFIVVNREYGGNSRIKNILENLKLTQCQRSNLDDISHSDLNLQINWDEVSNVLASKRKKSENFLNEVLELSPTTKDLYSDPKLDKIRTKYEKKYQKKKQKLQNKNKKNIFNTLMNLFTKN